jgi:predicted transcriptional regulator
MRSEKMTGRKCYDHLGGRLGAKLLEFYLENGFIELDEGKTTVYVVTEKGYEEFERMGLYLDDKGQNT